MRKTSFIAVIITLVMLFALGCDKPTNQSEKETSSNVSSVEESSSLESAKEEALPTYEELVALNTYSEILKLYTNFYVKNEWVEVLAETTNVQEMVFMQNNGKIEYHMETSVVGEDEYVSKVSRIGGEWYYYASNDPYMLTPYYSALEIDCEFFDYCLPELIVGEPVGRAYVENEYIVYHASYIQQATEYYDAARSDYTYYFNKETKLIEKIYEKSYDNTNSVVAIYNVEFLYDVKIEDLFSQTLREIIYSSEKRIDIEVVVGGEEEKKVHPFVTTTDSQYVVVINNQTYNLYTDAEYKNLVSSLSQFEGQNKVTLYAKPMYQE